MKFYLKSHAGLLALGLALTTASIDAFTPVVFAKKAPAADAFEGTSDEDLKQLKEATKLPQPAQIKLAVLPFHDFADYKLRMREATATTFLYWEHEGFQMVPMADSINALAADKAVEPGEALRRADAVRLGKALGADWAIYGEIKNVDSYEKTSLFSQKKGGSLTVRLSVVDCKSEELVYWRTLSASHSAPRGLGGEKRDKINRMALEVAVRYLSDPFFAALPEHATVANVKGKNAAHQIDDNDILGFIKQTWLSGK